MFHSQRHKVRKGLHPWRSTISRGVPVFINLANQPSKHVAHSHRSLWQLTGKSMMDITGLLKTCYLQFLLLLLKGRKGGRKEEKKEGRKEGRKEKSEGKEEREGGKEK